MSLERKAIIVIAKAVLILFRGLDGKLDISMGEVTRHQRAVKDMLENLGEERSTLR